MDVKYYRVGTVVFRTRESDEEFYIERKDGDQWTMAPDLMGYVFAGEPGVETISESEVNKTPA